MRAQQGDQVAIRMVRMVRERRSPLDQWPNPGDPFIEEVEEVDLANPLLADRPDRRARGGAGRA